MTDKNIYKFDQWMPLLGRIRRMAPNEEKRQDALMTTWINTVFGAGIRVNTPRMKKSEYARRAREYAETWRDDTDREWRNIRAKLSLVGKVGVLEAQRNLLVG